MKINCNICKKPLKIKKSLAYFTCMCNDEIRIIPLDQIKRELDLNFLYLYIEQKDINYV